MENTVRLTFTKEIVTISNYTEGLSEELIYFKVI